MSVAALGSVGTARLYAIASIVDSLTLHHRCVLKSRVTCRDTIVAYNCTIVVVHIYLKLCVDCEERTMQCIEIAFLYVSSIVL